MYGYFGLNNNYIANLGNIGDVNVDGVFDNQGIVWDASIGKWRNANVVINSRVLINRYEDLPTMDEYGIIHLLDATLYEFNQRITFIIYGKLEFGYDTYFVNGSVAAFGLIARTGGTFYTQDSVFINLGADAMVSGNDLGEISRFSKTTFINSQENVGSIFDVATTGANNFMILDEVAIRGVTNVQPIYDLGIINGFQVVLKYCIMLNFQIGLKFINIKGLTNVVTNMQTWPYAVNLICYNFQGTTIGPVNISLGTTAIFNEYQYIFNFPNTISYSGVTATGNVPILLGNALASNIFYPTSLDQKYPIFRFYANVYPSDSTVFNKSIAINNTIQTPITRFGNIKNIWFRIAIDPAQIIYESTERIINTGFSMRYIAVEDNNLGVQCLLDCNNFGTNKEYITVINKIGNIAYNFTVNDANDSLLYINHGLTLGQPLRLSTTGTLPSGLYDDILYFVTAIISVDEFRIGYQAGGASVALTGTGSGIHSYNKSKLLYNTFNAIMTSGVKQKFVINETVSLANNDQLEILAMTTSTPTANIRVNNGTFEIIKG